MPVQRFSKEARAAVTAATEEARADGRGLIEAEDLLLALADDQRLRDLGLDYDGLTEALRREEQQSLAAVGVVAEPPELSRLTRPRTPRLATSAKLALERAVKVTARRRQRRITSGALLLGVIAAEHGRVPRALDLAGVDVRELRARL